MLSDGQEIDTVTGRCIGINGGCQILELPQHLGASPSSGFNRVGTLHENKRVDILKDVALRGNRAADRHSGFVVQVASLPVVVRTSTVAGRGEAASLSPEGRAS